DRNLDGRNEIALLIRLDEMRQSPSVARLFDDFKLTGSVQHQPAAYPFGGDDSVCFEAIHPRHLDVEDGQVWLQIADERDRIVATAGFAADVVALLFEGLAQIETDDCLILGDHNTNRHWRQSLLNWFGLEWSGRQVSE